MKTISVDSTVRCAIIMRSREVSEKRVDKAKAVKVLQQSIKLKFLLNTIYRPVFYKLCNLPGRPTFITEVLRTAG